MSRLRQKTRDAGLPLPARLARRYPAPSVTKTRTAPAHGAAEHRETECCAHERRRAWPRDDCRQDSGRGRRGAQSWSRSANRFHEFRRSSMPKFDGTSDRLRAHREEQVREECDVLLAIGAEILRLIAGSAGAQRQQ